MAEGRRCIPNQQLDLVQIVREAPHRWLRPPEICEILGNYQNFKLEETPPVTPQAGSLFLFDRKSLRYFRRDGHRWRKKKDGKTVKEAHEKLKAGSVDVLHCYYAHGEDNQYFQRRSYWMLEEHLEHIVLVHYREVKEGYKSGVARLLAARPGGNPQTSCFTQGNSTIQTSHHTSSQNRVDWNGQTLSSELDDVDSARGSASGFSVTQTYHSLSPNASLSEVGVAVLPELSRNPPNAWLPGQKDSDWNASSLWPLLHTSSRNGSFGVHGQKFFDEQPSGSDFISHESINVGLDADGADPDIVSCQELLKFTEEDAKVATDCPQRVIQVPQEYDFNSILSQMQNYSSPPTVDAFGIQVESKFKDELANVGESGDLKKLDSFGRWMDKELGGNCEYSLMGSDSATYWNTLDTETDEKEVSSLSHHMQLDVDSLDPCLSQKKIFSICDFSPDCALSGIETKALIDKVLPGPVHTKLNVSEDDVYLQTRLAKLLSLGLERKWLDCSVDGCDGCKVKNTIYSGTSDSVKDCRNPKDLLIENLLREKLNEWLVYKVHEGGKGAQILDDEGLGVIHLTAALGYEWAVAPIVDSGVNINFRDVQGRTALHWASYFGREEMVIGLVRLGAYLGAVNDPTPAFPGGHTAADLASSRGHKGIAGYLAEAYLADHLSSMTINKNANINVAATEKNITDMATQDLLLDVSSKGPFVAVQKSARVAALIQDAFRTYSFRHRQLKKSSDKITELSLDLVALGSLNKVQRHRHFEDYLHGAAVKIQQKYRGWKGRAEFLKIRKRIVKIQAHVRGHQVRKQYKKVVWSVSIVEKAILRWRRRGAGLRGFRVHSAIRDVVSGSEKADDYDFLRISRRQKFAGVEKALARVNSMARNPEARDQYMRLVTRFENMKR